MKAEMRAGAEDVTEGDDKVERDCDAEIWCDECGELGWDGVCPACLELPPASG